MSPQTREQSVVQEPEGVAFRRLALLGGAVILVTVGCLLVILWMLPPDLMRKPVLPPEPGDPISSVRQRGFESAAVGTQEAREARDRLDEYGWAQRDGGVAMVPIDEAMEMYVKKHDAGGGAP